MELEIVIEKVNDDVVIPLDSVSENSLQIRSDGVLLNGELHIWEEIMLVHITNRELMRKLSKK